MLRLNPLRFKLSCIPICLRWTPSESAKKKAWQSWAIATLETFLMSRLICKEKSHPFSPCQASLRLLNAILRPLVKLSFDGPCKEAPAPSPSHKRLSAFAKTSLSSTSSWQLKKWLSSTTSNATEDTTTQRDTLRREWELSAPSGIDEPLLGTSYLHLDPRFSSWLAVAKVALTLFHSSEKLEMTQKHRCRGEWCVTDFDENGHK